MAKVRRWSTFKRGLVSGNHTMGMAILMRNLNKQMVRNCRMFKKVRIRNKITAWPKVYTALSAKQTRTMGVTDTPSGKKC